MKQIILASNSPRRRELLQLLQRPFSIHVIDIDENMAEKDPSKLVQVLAEEKAKASYFDEKQDAIYIGADTVVVAQNHILGKPKSKKQAKEMIQTLQGKTHSVWTGVCLFDGKRSMKCCERTVVHVLPMSDKEMDTYIDTDEPMDKAGAYGIQGQFACFVSGIEGCYYNVMGLPISKVYSMLKQFALEND